MRTLKKISRYKDALIHSDQDLTYTSPLYRAQAEHLDLTLSYLRKRNCLDNACMKSFYGYLKSETIYQMPVVEKYSHTRLN